MPNIRITKAFDWEMAHALDHHDGKCHNIHGHTYSLEVTFFGQPIDEIGSPKDGMVIDFADLKRIVKTHIVNVFDHALVLRDNSRFLGKLTTADNERLVIVPYQPTCENMLIHMVDVIREHMKDFPSVTLHSAMLRETKTSYATWYASENQ